MTRYPTCKSANIGYPPPPRMYIYVITAGENRHNYRMAIAIGWKAA